MDLLQKGSKSAFEEIYKRYSKTLLAFIYRMVNGDRTAAQDILHDVFLKLIESPNSFDTTKKFKSWIYTVAANASRKSHRKPKTIEIDDNNKNSIGRTHQPNLADKKEFDKSLHKSLCKLSDEHKEVFMLKHQQHLSTKEISQTLNIPEGTVKSRLFTATKKMAKNLKQYNPREAI
jgi:RNA polymerase sigma-70 factor (ECF subfamily)